MTASRPPRRAVVAGLGALGAGVLASCARIPSRSGVLAGPEVGAGGGGSPYLAPNPPARGAGPQEIVRGFLQAGLGSENEWAVAREYLAPAAAREWDPRAQITVFEAAEDIVLSGNDSSVTATLSAELIVDALGTARAERPAATRRLEFTLTEIDGEHRIAEAPAGIVASSSAFELLYRSSPVYFVSRDDALLVPEERWFLASRHPYEVVAGLTRGPSAVLEAAVRNHLPADADLTEDSVRVEQGGRAVLQLPAAFYSRPYRSRRLAVEQIRTSLVSTGVVSDVVVRSGDIILATEPADDVAGPVRPLPGSEPYAASMTAGVVRLGGDGAAGSLVPGLEQTRVTGPRLRSGSPWAVALADDRTTLLVATLDDSVPVRTAATGTDLVAPALDRFDYAWTAPAASGGALLAVPCAEGGGHVAVSAPWLEGRTLGAIALAPEGTRLLVASAGSEGARVELVAVVRDDAGRPTELVTTGRVLLRAGELTSLEWSGETEAIVVVRQPITGARDEVTAGDASVILRLSLDASLESLPAPPAEAHRAALSTVADQTYLTTPEGDLYVRTGDDWSRAGADVTDPAFR